MTTASFPHSHSPDDECYARQNQEGCGNGSRWDSLGTAPKPADPKLTTDFGKLAHHKLG